LYHASRTGPVGRETNVLERDASIRLECVNLALDLEPPVQRLVVDRRTSGLGNKDLFGAIKRSEVLVEKVFLLCRSTPRSHPQPYRVGLDGKVLPPDIQRRNDHCRQGECLDRPLRTGESEAVKETTQRRVDLVLLWLEVFHRVKEGRASTESKVD
jgi:hypothetical protein